MLAKMRISNEIEEHFINYGELGRNTQQYTDYTEITQTLTISKKTAISTAVYFLVARPLISAWVLCPAVALILSCAKYRSGRVRLNEQHLAHP